ncbi:unnamed protein product [Coffea canephora]|uniref:Glucan endo-1,3-beta-D-glucosidase n=1 Tax=Coffea canephora TaxID=49390 RepID=A0A068U655_COFCA|nr:unnamed protein product [Coffea canephora]
MHVTVQMKSFLLIIFPMVLAITTMLLPIAIAGDKIDIGVCYGMVADNLPPAAEVIALYKKYSIGKLRLFDANRDALRALKGSDIDVTLGVKNEDIPNIAASVDGARSWFTTNLQPYTNDITFAFVSVGNEAIPGEFADSIAPAMKNLQSVLSDDNLNGITLLASSKNLLSWSTCLYPYFDHAADRSHQHSSLDFAQFTANEPVLLGSGNLNYTKLYDATLVAFLWAVERARFRNLQN